MASVPPRICRFPTSPRREAPTADTASTVAAKADGSGGESDDLTGKKKKGIALAQKVSRVTVLLPGKN